MPERKDKTSYSEYKTHCYKPALHEKIRMYSSDTRMIVRHSIATAHFTLKKHCRKNSAQNKYLLLMPICKVKTYSYKDKPDS